MNCPVCEQASLTMSERSGIEIDYCPRCRGIWLDRGELDKLIERAAVAATRPVSASAYGAEVGSYSPAPAHGRAHADAYSHSGYHPKKKRDSFLGELFDFD